MNSLDVYEVRPGVFLRLRASEAQRFGYVLASVKHKAAAPTLTKKAKKKAAPIESDEEEVDA